MTSTGNPAATYSILSGSLPAGLTLNPSTGLISGATTAAPGTSYFTVKASNAIGSATQNMTLTVQTLPAFTSSASATFVEGRAGQFLITAPASPTTTSYAIASGALPSGLTLNTTTGLLSGTPAVGTNGSYSFTIQATNAAGSTTQNFAMAVQLQPAITSVASATFMQGSQSSFQVTSTGNPSATYSIVGGSLPSGLSLNATTGLISGTPTSNGNYNFTLQASNGAGTANQTFALSAQSPPTFTSGQTATWREGQAVSFSVTATGTPAPLYSIVTGSLPSGLTLNPATGLISGTPAVGSNGNYAFTIQASNSVGSATQTSTVAVQAPPAFTSGTSVTFTENAPGSFPVTTTGNLAATYSLSAGTLPSGVTLNSTTGLLSGTPATGTHGPWIFTILASNSLGSSTQTVSLAVQAPPSFTGPSTATFNAVNPSYFLVSSTAYPAATYSLASGTLPLGVTLNSVTGVISGTPTASSFGNYAFTIQAANAAGSTNQTFALSVQIKPTITSAAAATFAQAMPNQFTITSTGNPVSTYSIVSGSGSLPAGVTLNPTTGAITGTPAAGTAGSWYFALRATNVLGSVTQNFVLTVVPPPVFTTSAAAPFIEGTQGRFLVNATGIPSGTYSVVSGSLPTGVTLDGTTGVLSGTPTSGSHGVWSFTIQDSNGTWTLTQNFSLTVLINIPFSSAAGTTFTYGSLGGFQVATGAAAPVTYSIVNGALPTGVTLNATTGALSGLPSAQAIGTWTFTIQASNATCIGDQAFTLVVQKGNLVIAGNNLTKVYGTTYTFTGNEYTVTGLAAGDTITAPSMLTSFGADATAPVGTYNVEPAGAVVSNANGYNITYAMGTFTVTQATLTITPTAVSKVYGNGVDVSTDSYTTTGLMNNDAINGLTINGDGTSAGASVGTYGIYASGVFGHGLQNYNIVYATGTLTVTPAALTITANSRDKTQGATVFFSGDEFTASGLVNGDAIKSVAVSSAGTGAAAAIGSYSIAVSGAVGSALSNYAITYVPGTMTVLAAENFGTTGVFTTGSTGLVSINYLFDGGAYQGEMGIYSLAGLSAYVPGSAAYNEEVARRVLTNSDEGYLVVNKSTDAAKNTESLSFEGSYSSGTYRGIQTFQMDANAQFGIVLIPSGTFAQVLANPGVGGATRPLYSISAANPAQAINGGAQLAQITSNVYGWEDRRLDGASLGLPASDEDYNDLVFSISGASGLATPYASIVNPGRDMLNDPNFPAIIS